MIGYTTGDISSIAHGTLSGDPTRVIRQVSTDTRRIVSPQESLFVALRGPSHDGHRYLHEACKAGIRSFLLAEMPVRPEEFPESTFILVADPLVALQDIAAWHRSRFRGQVIAVTGSNGKTIIKEWLAQLMQPACRIVKSPKSFNSQLGVPLSVLNINGDEDFAVIEAGISKPGEMENLQRIIQPNIGLISNIGDAHQENFSDLTGKLREKLVLFRNAGKIFFCHDQELIRKELEASGYPGQLVSWSRYAQADLRIVKGETSGHSSRLTALFRGKETSVEIPAADAASIENFCLIWLVLLDLGFDPDSVAKSARRLEPVRMRLEQKAGINNCSLINDFYNSDVVSLGIALDLLFQQTPQVRKTVILSDILQTGLPEVELYSKVSRLLHSRLIDRLIGIGPALCRNRNLFELPIETWPTTAEFLNHINPSEFRDEAILLKGARIFTFEQISACLEAKIHATTLEIRMSDVRFNLEQYRSLLDRDVRIMAMVKAFSYGSGTIEMASFLANERVDYLGVAFADEGMEIRRAGIRIPIMVMNPDFRQSELLIENHLEPEIFNWSGLRLFAATARDLGITRYPIHLKIDSGMHRLGFDHRETAAIASFLEANPQLRLESVFSHLSASEDPSQDDFTLLQINRFQKACSDLQRFVGYPFLRHILNSSGIERFPQARFDMVRLGIGLHGIGSTEIIARKPVATLKTVISQVHELQAGEAVGYGRLAVLPSPSRIAVIPVGYADGIDRRLGNGRFTVLVDGRRVPTIGHICMDMTLIDITGTRAEEGDEVIIFGPSNPVTEMADALGTISYEVLTSIAPRVKRLFLFD